MLGVRAIPSQLTIVSTIVNECLPDYSVIDQQFVKSQLLELTNIKNETNDFLMSAEKQLLAVWILLTSESTNTGRFSFMYKRNLKQVITNRDKKGFKQLWDLGINNFGEYINNKELTQVERDSIEKMINIEYESISLAIDKSIYDMGNLLCRPFINNIDKSFKLSGHGVTLYGLCYSEICASRDKYYQYPGMDKLLDGINCPVIDGNETQYVCINLIKLIKILVGDDSLAINPKVRQILIDKFSIEIKLYKHYTNTAKHNTGFFSST